MPHVGSYRILAASSEGRCRTELLFARKATAFWCEHGRRRVASRAEALRGRVSPRARRGRRRKRVSRMLEPAAPTALQSGREKSGDGNGGRRMALSLPFLTINHNFKKPLIIPTLVTKKLFFPPITRASVRRDAEPAVHSYLGRYHSRRVQIEALSSHCGALLGLHLC